MIFETAWVRFAICGTLILLHSIVDGLARRAPGWQRLPATPVWLRALVLVSICAFYTLIGPTGGPLLGGVGNLMGICAALVVTAVRPAGLVRYPEVTSRCLFYVALPLAVGVPWGLLVLSAPACITSVLRCRHADRSMLNAQELPFLPRHRMLPGIW